MCRSMLDIHSATAEIRREKKKKKQDKNIMSASATQDGHNNKHLNGNICLSITINAK